MSRRYEIMFIMDPVEEKANKGIEDIKRYIDEVNGTIEKEDKMGIRELAYTIKKKKKGYYYLIETKISPKEMSTLNREILINENILKYMSINLEN